MACVALITAGAAGNIIDSVFYGMIFNNPMPPAVAQMFPRRGYAPLFHGKVVDMLYFPLFSFYWPDWVPFIGGQFLSVLSADIHIADAAITVGNSRLDIVLLKRPCPFPRMRSLNLL